MSRIYTDRVIEACLEGDTSRVLSLFADNDELDTKAFVEGAFKAGSDAFKKCPFNSDAFVYLWHTIPVYPELDPDIVTSIELVLVEYDGLLDSNAVGSMLRFACCAHINLVPIILRLFKDRLGPWSAVNGIDACWSRYPEMRWFIMREYMDEFTGRTIQECFNSCCYAGNLTMLELLIDHHYTELEAYNQENQQRKIYIDEGIMRCCWDGDIEVIQLLASKCRFLGPRLLYACIDNKDLEAARLVLNECKEFLTIESETQGCALSPRAKKGFAKAIENDDTDMLELIVAELKDDLERETKEAAFMASFSYYDVPFAKTMLRLCSYDLMFEDGSEGEPPEEMPTEAMWELLVETYSDRVWRTDTNWGIASMNE